MLHLANGESTAALLNRADLPDTVVNADDILLEGPPAPLESRARFLEKYLEIGRDEYMRRWQQRLHLLARALEENEAVLWFEEDLWCQLNYLHALSWLASRVNGGRMSYVCPPEGRLGEMTPARLATLFDERRPVTRELLQTASTAWGYLCADDPRALADYARSGDFSAWPALREGLRLHLARLPHTGTGLGQHELAILQALRNRPLEFAELFAEFSRIQPGYGAADVCVQRYLVDLQPVLELGERISLAERADDVLDGTTDFLEIAQPDRWVGGVHVTAHAQWRWDPHTNNVRER